MKKWILLFCLSMSFGLIAEVLNPVKYENEISPACRMDTLTSSKVFRSIQLINAIDSSQSSVERKILSMILHLELEELEHRMKCYDEWMGNCIELSKRIISTSNDPKAIRAELENIKRIEKFLDEKKKYYSLIKEWKDKYILTED